MRQLPILDAEVLAHAQVAETEALATIEAGLAAVGLNEAQQPHPPALSPRAGAFFQPLIAALPTDNIACVNWLTYHPENVTVGLPHSGGVLILNDFTTGEPLCVMDGIWVSRRRAGYVAGLGVKYLAGDFHDVAVIGPGSIAAFAVDAIAALGLLHGKLSCAYADAARRTLKNSVRRRSPAWESGECRTRMHELLFRSRGSC
jgi:ornithine cyclodeaminase/alanine dehydrogenase-like protein (mu-crystallin family)